MVLQEYFEKVRFSMKSTGNFDNLKTNLTDSSIDNFSNVLKNGLCGNGSKNRTNDIPSSAFGELMAAESQSPAILLEPTGPRCWGLNLVKKRHNYEEGIFSASNR
jgi:hypothetical protein